MYNESNPPEQRHESGGGNPRPMGQVRLCTPQEDATLKAMVHGGGMRSTGQVRTATAAEVTAANIQVRCHNPQARASGTLKVQSPGKRLMRIRSAEDGKRPLAHRPPRSNRTAAAQPVLIGATVQTSGANSAGEGATDDGGGGGGSIGDGEGDGSGDADADGSHTRVVHLPPSSTHHLAPRQHSARSLAPGGAR